MTNDNERREIAAKMREHADRKDQFFAFALANLIKGETYDWREDLLNGSFWRTLADLIDPEEEQVLDRDGVPIEVGDTCWITDDKGRAICSVDEFCVVAVFYVNGTPRAFVKNESFTRGHIVDAIKLTHKKPDSLKRIAQEAAKSSTDYWGCDEYSCGNCPAKQEGNTPCERYGVGSCWHAMVLDLLRRQRELLGGDE